MRVTLNQIAEAAGVSRGTVDRALNNRGRIKPEVADKIRALAEKMGYQRNMAGRALAMSANSLKIGVVVQAADTPFIQNVIKGIEEVTTQIERMGCEVHIRRIPDMDSAQAVKALDELYNEGCKGIALMPSEDPAVIEKVNSLAEEGIPVITFNSDIEESARQCYVGLDNRQGGYTAAGLMAEILPEGADVAVISGYPTNQAHRNRARGFMDELVRIRPDLEIDDVMYAFDKDNIAEQLTEEFLKEHRGPVGIYLAASGIEGACHAMYSESAKERVKLISHDLIESNISRLKAGDVTFLIGQDARTQGYEPVNILYRQLFEMEEPVREDIHTEIAIKTKYNVS